MSILLGLKSMPSYRGYWSPRFELRDPYVPYITNAMGRDRFGFLLSNLHINGNATKKTKQYLSLINVTKFGRSLIHCHILF